MRRFVTYHIKELKEESEIFRKGHITARGIIGVSNRHPKTKVFLEEKIAEYHNRIVTECSILGIAWSAIGCDVNRCDDFYKLTTPMVREAARTGVFDVVEKECELFLEYLIVIFFLMAQVESKTNISIVKTTDELLAYWIKCDDSKREQLMTELSLLLKGEKGRRVAYVILALERKGYMLSMDRDVKKIYCLFKEAFGIEGTEEAIRQQLEKPIDTKREDAIRSIEERLP